jgi:hypothetical protein
MHLEAAHPGKRVSYPISNIKLCWAPRNMVYGYWVVVEGENTGSLAFLRA